MKKIDRKFRLARIWSNNELKKFAHLFEGKVINVSAGENIDKEGSTYDGYFSNASEFWLSNFSPGAYRGFASRENELLIDLTSPLSSEYEGRFEVAFNHTTLEHIFDVFTAFENICKLTNDIAIIVVPFAQEQHENEGYKDYWRFTPTCMRKLFELNKMEVLYESANNDFNAATYLFYIASKKPELWRDKIESCQPIKNAASWIGSIQKSKGLFNKLLK
jgi:hypothetical protein